MKTGLLIDTDVLVDYLAGVRQAAEFLEYRKDDLAVSVLTISEILTGVRNEAELDAVETMLGAFVSLPIDGTVARRAAVLKRELAATTITTGACLIAATALTHGLRLVTLQRRTYPLVRELHVPYRRIL